MDQDLAFAGIPRTLATTAHDRDARDRDTHDTDPFHVGRPSDVEMQAHPPEGPPEPGRSLRIHALDGYELGATFFEATSPRLRVLITGGTGVPARFYRHFAAWLAARGASTLTFDYRGIGASRSGSLRGAPHGYLDWATSDLPAALETLESLAPNVPTVIVGHSFGGQALGLTDAAKRADALVMVAAQSGYWKHWQGAKRWKLGLLWHVTAPLVTGAVGYVPGSLGVGEDLPARVMDDWARWCRTPGYYTSHVAGASERLASFSMPRLVLGFDDDGYAPKAAVDALASWQSSPSLDRVQLAPEDLARTRIGHFGFFRPGVTRGWSWLLGWIDDALEARLEGGDAGGPR